MRCAVERLSGQSTFDVHWFQRYINGTVVDHGRPDLVTDGPDMENVQFGGHLINTQPSDDYLGEYWCQVVDTTADVQYLGVSDSIVIENYTFYGNAPRCTEIATENTNICADTAPVVVSSSTPLPTSSSSQTTISSTTSTQG